MRVRLHKKHDETEAALNREGVGNERARGGGLDDKSGKN